MNTLDQIRELLPPVPEINGDTRFDAIGMDSLDYLQFLVDLEEKFNVDVPNADAKKFRTVRDVERWLTRQL